MLQDNLTIYKHLYSGWLLVLGGVVKGFRAHFIHTSKIHKNVVIYLTYNYTHPSFESLQKLVK